MHLTSGRSFAIQNRRQKLDTLEDLSHHEQVELLGNVTSLLSNKKALIVERIPEAKYHPDTGEIYSKIGACLARQGELKRACVEYGNALSIYAVTLGSDHHDTKDALRNIQNLPALMIR